MKASDVRSNWSQLLNKVFRGETDVVVEKSGIPVAAIVSAQDFAELKQIREQRKREFALLKEVRSRFSDQSQEQITAGVAESITQARKETPREKASPA